MSSLFAASTRVRGGQEAHDKALLLAYVRTCFYERQRSGGVWRMYERRWARSSAVEWQGRVEQASRSDRERAKEGIVTVLASLEERQEVRSPLTAQLPSFRDRPRADLLLPLQQIEANPRWNAFRMRLKDWWSSSSLPIRTVLSSGSLCAPFRSSITSSRSLRPGPYGRYAPLLLAQGTRC